MLSLDALRRLGATGRHAARLREETPPEPGLRLGRVAEDRGIRYIVAFDPLAAPTEALAETGPELLRAFRRGEGPRPVVGDWVWAWAPKISRNPHVIKAILPRQGAFTRRRPHSLDAQVLAANADLAFLLSAVGPDFNPRRIERYLAAASSANAKAIVVLGKCDLEPDRDRYHEALAPLLPPEQILEWSAVSGAGMDAIRARLAPGHTAALLGSSGVGKSTLINRLLGEERLDTTEVRRDGKGRHTTTRRQLVLLESGGAIIDTPGIRELALFDADEGVTETFEEVEALAARCRFGDCRHDAEPGCAVQAALADGSVDPQRVGSYLKLREELEETAKERARRKKPSRSRRGRG